MVSDKILEHLEIDPESDYKRNTLREEVAKLESATESIELLARRIDESNINEYLAIMGDTRTLFKRSLLSGIAKGIGFAFGFALLGALALYILNLIVGWNLPIIGDLIAEILFYVENSQAFMY